MNEQKQFYEEKLKYEIDSWDLFESLNQSKDIKVIDARSQAAFEQEHIPESINIPHRTMNVETTSHLNKETLYVVYCDGIGCNASTKGALNMTNLGFKIKELLGGLDWWKRDGYQTHGIKGNSGIKIECGC